MTRVERLVEAIEGTCKTTEEVCEMLGFEWEDLTVEEVEEFDQEVFCCEDCGWWWPLHVQADCDDFICQECYKDRVEEGYYAE